MELNLGLYKGIDTPAAPDMSKLMLGNAQVEDPSTSPTWDVVKLQAKQSAEVFSDFVDLSLGGVASIFKNLAPDESKMSKIWGEAEDFWYGRVRTGTDKATRISPALMEQANKFVTIPAQIAMDLSTLIIPVVGAGITAGRLATRIGLQTLEATGGDVETAQRATAIEGLTFTAMAYLAPMSKAGMEAVRTATTKTAPGIYKELVAGGVINLSAGAIGRGVQQANLAVDHPELVQWSEVYGLEPVLFDLALWGFTARIGYKQHLRDAAKLGFDADQLNKARAAVQDVLARNPEVLDAVDTLQTFDEATIDGLVTRWKQEDVDAVAVRDDILASPLGEIVAKEWEAEHAATVREVRQDGFGEYSQADEGSVQPEASRGYSVAEGRSAEEVGTWSDIYEVFVAPVNNTSRVVKGIAGPATESQFTRMLRDNGFTSLLTEVDTNMPKAKYAKKDVIAVVKKLSKGFDIDSMTDNQRPIAQDLLADMANIADMAREAEATRLPTASEHRANHPQMEGESMKDYMQRLDVEYRKLAEPTVKIKTIDEAGEVKEVEMPAKEALKQYEETDSILSQIASCVRGE